MAVDDSYTISLLHFEGIDTSTDFVDESGKSWTIEGASQIDTAQYRFGGASGLFATATSDRIYTADNVDWTVGSDDWTVEAWIKLSATDTAAHMIFNSCTTPTPGNTSDQTIEFRLAITTLIPTCSCGISGGTSATAAAGSAVNDTNWHHVAAVKYGGNLRVYLDGVGGVSTALTAALNDPTVISIAGAVSSSQALRGWMDEFRFSKGIARYTVDFTPYGPFYAISGENPYFADGYSVY